VIAEGTAAELKAQLGDTIIRIDGPLIRASPTRRRPFSPKSAPTDLSEDGRSIEVKVADSGRSLVAVVRKLDAAGIEPAAVIVREPSLDDVFLTLTGPSHGRLVTTWRTCN